MHAIWLKIGYKDIFYPYPYAPLSVVSATKLQAFFRPVTDDYCPLTRLIIGQAANELDHHILNRGDKDRERIAILKKILNLSDPTGNLKLCCDIAIKLCL